MTELYLIRHGLAGESGSYADDTQRPLTEEGQQKTHVIAKRLLQLQLQFDLILTSPLVRARQTAEILQEVGLGTQLEASSYLSPGGDFEGWLNWLKDWRKSNNTALALVGHEPDLSHWAEQLVWGKATGRLVLKKAGVIGINLPNSSNPIGKSELFWLTPPRLLL
jgi:phosphohistidine phosphatase